ncbi:hypothetical protein L227DRAFT_261632 [Lentinus tigrinus ALCF2SS1-6]|uniref:Uncharacterized protein n=1 Tax=Lentinus tigrinus ALCF2SS1-6 TaxID=1328759 RepID=A0A5C2SLQ8_9APHY|nr:hypothetical protein L227DRAFT_261632 [Lentinus tigrinus ALCF2SS1-6]
MGETMEHDGALLNVLARCDAREGIGKPHRRQLPRGRWAEVVGRTRRRRSSSLRMNDLGLFDIRTPFWQSICRPGSASRRRSPGDSCGLGSRKANRAKLGGSVLRPRRPVPPHVVPQFADLSVWDIRRAGRARFRGCVHPPASSLDKAFANTYVSTICIEAAGDGCHASGV